MVNCLTDEYNKGTHHRPNTTMTNKNKRATAKKGKVTASSSSKDALTAGPSVEATNPALKRFSKPQLALLLFLYVGGSKIMEFRTALKDGTEKTCMDYLNHEETCKHASFPSLILVKYYSSLQVTWLIISLVWHLWQSEAYFSKLVTCLCISPLTTTALACFSSRPYVEPRRLWHLFFMSCVLLSLAAPRSMDVIPFLPQTQQPNRTLKSLQSMCLLTLAMSILMEVGKVIRSDESLENSILLTETPFPEPARALVNFWLVVEFGEGRESHPSNAERQATTEHKT